MNSLGILMLRTGKPKRALDQFLRIADQLDGTSNVRQSLGDALNNAAIVHLQQEKYGEAGKYFSRAFDVWMKLGNLYGQVATLSNLGIVAEKEGKLVEAGSLYEKAVETAEEIGYLHGISAIEANRANLSVLNWRWQLAQKQASRSLHFASLICHKHSQAIALENLGNALAGFGLTEESNESLERAYNLASEMHDRTLCDSCRLSQTWVALQAAETERAEVYLGDVSDDVTPDLGRWKETLTLTIQALKDRDGELMIRDRRLTTFRNTASLENYLRRLDTLLLLCDRGVLSYPRQELLELRKKCLSN